MTAQQFLPIGRHGIPLEIELEQPDIETSERRLAEARALCDQFRREWPLLPDDRRLCLASDMEDEV